MTDSGGYFLRGLHGVISYVDSRAAFDGILGVGIPAAAVDKVAMPMQNLVDQGKLSKNTFALLLTSGDKLLSRECTVRNVETGNCFYSPAISLLAEIHSLANFAGTRGDSPTRLFTLQMPHS